MTRKFLLLVLAANGAMAATPREYVADKVGDARSKLKAAEKKIDDLPAALAEATEIIGDVRGKLKNITPQLAAAQDNLDVAQTNLTAALAGNKSMGEALRALPPVTPERDSLIKRNDAQGVHLAAADAALKNAKTSLADGIKALGETEPKLKLVHDKLSGAKDLPSTKQVNEVIDLMDVVLKVNKAAMPDFPNIKELK